MEGLPSENWMNAGREHTDYMERPAKKARMEAPSSPAGSATADVFDDTDDLYEDLIKVTSPFSQQHQLSSNVGNPSPKASLQFLSGTIPGLGLLGLWSEEKHPPNDNTVDVSSDNNLHMKITSNETEQEQDVENMSSSLPGFFQPLSPSLQMKSASALSDPSSANEEEGGRKDFQEGTQSQLLKPTSPARKMPTPADEIDVEPTSISSPLELEVTVGQDIVQDDSDSEEYFPEDVNSNVQASNGAGEDSTYPYPAPLLPRSENGRGHIDSHVSSTAIDTSREPNDFASSHDAHPISQAIPDTSTLKNSASVHEQCELDTILSNGGNKDVAHDSDAFIKKEVQPIRTEESSIARGDTSVPPMDISESAHEELSGQKSEPALDPKTAHSVGQAIWSYAEPSSGMNSSANPAEDNSHHDLPSAESTKLVHNDEEAEWQYDSSDVQSTSSSQSSQSSSSESGDEEAYQLLDPEEQVRILMRGEGAEEDDGKKSGQIANGPLRTANEQLEEVVQKPDIIVTPEMEIMELGVVDNVVENYLLIKGSKSGETRVLGSGSVLCLEDRTVIGAVTEPLGRVEEPLYSVAFTNASEIKQYSLDKGKKVFYVVDHSHYVFTQSLKFVKGTDASNQHDEEAGEDEIEFSDDEAEAEHKRKVKKERHGKKATRIETDANISTRRPINRTTPQVAAEYPTEAINYDDNDQVEDIYTPLARPSNLLDMTLPPKPPGPIPNGREFSEQFRVRRGQGDRGRGMPKGQQDRATGVQRVLGNQRRNNQRGDRDNRSHVRQGRKPEQSGHGPHTSTGHQLRHATQSEQSSAAALEYPPGRPIQPVGHPLTSPMQSSSTPLENLYSLHLSPPYQTASQFLSSVNPNAVYQGYVSSQQQHQTPTSPGGSLPAGAFINPAFFRHQLQPNLQAPISYSHPQYQPQPYQQVYQQQPYQQYPYPQTAYPQANQNLPYQPQHQQYPYELPTPASQWSRQPYQTHPGAQYGGSG